MFALPAPPNAMPTGALQIWPTDTAPDGWLLCYGQAVSRITYADLFELIGTTFGVGDGSTTFNLPDLRGRITLGKDNMGGVSADRVTNANADTIGGAEGAESHTLTIAELAVHRHALEGTRTLGDNAYPTNAILGKGNDGAYNYVQQDPDYTMREKAINTTGSDNAHNNMSPYITTTYIIKE